MINISVVCPTYNSAKFIEATLETVVRQTRLPDELVISDDGSADDTLDVVERFLSAHAGAMPWRILRNAHRGPGATRNAGIRAATGNWIAFLDSDDLWELNKIERIGQEIADHGDANFFCHDELLVGKNGQTSTLVYGGRYNGERPLPPQLYFANMFSTSAVVCRRDLLIAHGCFDESLMSAQDYELWLRLSPFMRPVFVHDILGRYVERAGNITSSSLQRRLKNELLIARMHRHKVSAPWFLVRVGRILLSYARQFARASLA
ncbi:glycosyltransferase [Massilia solisilvae]|uniref:Glycosyltransferase n=1 Tax=Massilia solisilvae TaxID=1811225 RepID=A0ABT2BEP9_9BURK|nr:glycosyltransferase [Massilia solisilvae]MCS0606994.1 glycosyltransferase [Massilia solisilvae]